MTADPYPPGHPAHALEFRELLTEVFIDAERHELGRYRPEFTATPGQNDQAADFIGARVDHLLDARGLIGHRGDDVDAEIAGLDDGPDAA